jgi:uncharacterized protein YybS (DUF2232 family)
MVPTEKPLGAIPLWITRIAPFLLPAVFFQSAIFAFLSPLPLFLVTLKKRLSIALAALAVNIAIVYFTGIASEAIVATFFWLAGGILFPFLIRKSAKVELSFLLSIFYLLLMLGVGMFYLAHSAHMGVIEYARSEIVIGMDHLIALPDSPFKAVAEQEGRDSLLKQLMTELPSGIVIAVILSFWINLLFASQLVRGFLSKKFWANYRAPEILVWPTLACAGMFIWTEHAPYYIGLNGLKILLVAYGFQGLSVISFLLNHYKILGFVRALIFTLAIFVAMPMILALGFFDLWFDFRRKVVQS